MLLQTFLVMAILTDLGLSSLSYKGFACHLCTAEKKRGPCMKLQYNNGTTCHTGWCYTAILDEWWSDGRNIETVGYGRIVRDCVRNPAAAQHLDTVRRDRSNFRSVVYILKWRRVLAK